MSQTASATVCDLKPLPTSAMCAWQAATYPAQQAGGQSNNCPACCRGSFQACSEQALGVCMLCIGVKLVPLPAAATLLVYTRFEPTPALACSCLDHPCQVGFVTLAEALGSCTSCGLVRCVAPPCRLWTCHCHRCQSVCGPSSCPSASSLLLSKCIRAGAHNCCRMWCGTASTTSPTMTAGTPLERESLPQSSVAGCSCTG